MRHLRLTSERETLNRSPGLWTFVLSGYFRCRLRWHLPSLVFRALALRTHLAIDWQIPLATAKDQPPKPLPQRWFFFLNDVGEFIEKGRAESLGVGFGLIHEAENLF